jgi:hypothetical protein
MRSRARCRRASASGALAGLLLALALALPGTALGAGNVSVVLRGQASHGYDYELRGYSSGTVQMLLYRGRTSAAYLVHGRVTPGLLSANFGRLGRIALRTPVRYRRHARGTGCGANGRVIETGIAHGTLRFVGEGGYSSVERSSKGIRVSRRIPGSCRKRPASASDEPPQAPLIQLVAAARHKPGRTLFFEAFAYEPTASKSDPSRLLGTLIVGGARERRGRIAITRLAFGGSGAGALIATPPDQVPVVADVALPHPFSGTAQLTQQPGVETTWTGSLRAALPGLGSVPLTGPGFGALFCRVGSLNEKTSACLKQARDLTAH